MTNIRLAILLPFIAGLGACMMPMGKYVGPQSPGSASGPATTGPGASSQAAPTASNTDANKPSDPDKSSSAASGPTSFSIDLRNECEQDVNTFYGDNPDTSSGTFSSMEGNSTTSHMFDKGDVFWIVDNSRKGVTSIKPTASMHEIDISSDCKHLSGQ